MCRTPGFPASSVEPWDNTQWLPVLAHHVHMCVGDDLTIYSVNLGYCSIIYRWHFQYALMGILKIYLKKKSPRRFFTVLVLLHSLTRGPIRTTEKMERSNIQWMLTYKNFIIYKSLTDRIAKESENCSGNYE
jgi:hypothetical protein